MYSLRHVVVRDTSNAYARCFHVVDVNPVINLANNLFQIRICIFKAAYCGSGLVRHQLSTAGKKSGWKVEKFGRFQSSCSTALTAQSIIVSDVPCVLRSSVSKSSSSETLLTFIVS
jgi:hypothetical protein